MLKRLRDLFGEIPARYTCKFCSSCFSVRIHFYLGRGVFFCFVWTARGAGRVPLVMHHAFPFFPPVLSPSSGPCIPGIFGESRSWPEATFLSIFSALQSSFQHSLFALFILCVLLLGKYQMLPDVTPAVNIVPRPVTPDQTGWKLPGPTSSRGGTCETVKGCVNHAPVLGGISPKHICHIQRKKEERTKQ